MSKNFYITTTLPYINSKPHIGFAAEIIKADVIARYKRKLGYEVFFNTGTDEHGLKIHRKALENNQNTQDFCDEQSQNFKDLKSVLNLSFDKFIRTTDKDHMKSAQEFWKKCEANGDIYKKKYKIKYCVGCELEKTESELENGRCPWHPDKELEFIEEENYFFRFSKYQEPLLKLYKDNPKFVLPEFKFNEIKAFVENGLQDFSISRLKEKMPWGVEVPGDETQVIYVWFDALINYISTLGWPKNQENFEKFWPGFQVAGKDNLRQQTAMWQAMLMSAGLLNSQQVLIFGFLTNEGQKISKSLGNVIDPVELTNSYGEDVVRYYLLKQVPTFSDGDFSQQELETLYTSELANTLGNLISRVGNLIEKNQIKTEEGDYNHNQKLEKNLEEKMKNYQLNEAIKVLWEKIRETNEFLTEKQPWRLEDKEEVKKILLEARDNILSTSYWLEVFIPETAKKINEILNVSDIKKPKPLFPRLS